jgi:hypothetical protein
MTNYQKGVVIPLSQASILGVSGCVLGYIISILYPDYRWFLVSFCGTTLFIGWLWNAFDRSYGIRFPAKKKTVYATGVSTPMTTTTKITLISDNGRQGDYFLIPDFPICLLERVGFYLTFGECKLSHSYLDIQLSLFKRNDLEKFKSVLLQSKLAEFKDEKNKRRGLQLSEHGKKVFRELAKRYTPTPLEKRSMIKYFKNYDIRNVHNM